MFLDEGYDNMLRQYGNGVYEDMSVIAVNDDGSFELTEEMSEKFHTFWERIGFNTSRGGKVSSYNMAIVGVYSHLFNPVNRCCEINIDCIIVAIANRISVCGEKITHPGRLLEFLINFIRERADWIDNIREKNISCDIEAEICYSFAETVINILKKGE